MQLEPINFEKNWYTNSNANEKNWDEIANKTAAFSIRTVLYLKQLGLDISSNYIFNGNGQTSQTIPITDRLDTLEAIGANVGTQNIGLDLSTPSKVKIVGSDGSNLSATNKGQITFNDVNNPGELVTRDLTSNIELTLTGAHWGLDTLGDQTDYILWVAFADTGSDVILCVAAQGGRDTVTAADAVTSATSATSISKVFVSSAPGATLNLTYLGWVKADFDDTGNAGGENFWTIQTGAGDINIGNVPTRIYASEIRF